MTSMIILLALAAAAFLFLNRPIFGKNPAGERLAKIQKSQLYKNGKFQNLTPTSTMSGNFFTSMWKYTFNKSKRVKPAQPIPSIKTDLKNLPADKDIIVWLGHSSYFIKLEGNSFLVDPVFPSKSSLSYMINKPFPGADIYSPSDMPDTDYMVITHDHWDHLDYETAQAVNAKKIICPLGLGETLEYWGIAKDKIIEMAWQDEQTLADGVKIDCLSARHFSGRRGILGDKTLWASYLLNVNNFKVYIGGDSGSDTFFAAAGKKYGGVDLAILEDGQYNENWKNIHMMPEETYQAAKDLNAKALFPVHNGKFTISMHAWDEPFIRITKAAEDGNIKLFTPRIGQVVDIKDNTQAFSKWWEEIK